jgi:uncharacterized protein (UPF0332 family)
LGIEPKAFLDFAKTLLSDTSSEAALRSCVSRSYYALFNLMAQFIDKNIEKLSHMAEDHTTVYQYLNNCGIEDVEIIASNLHDLRDERNDSDYKLHLDKFNDQFTVSLLFKKASIAFDGFEKIIQRSKQRKHIAKGIQRYKKAINS